jgi:hypothetical protein
LKIKSSSKGKKYVKSSQQKTLSSSELSLKDQRSAFVFNILIKIIKTFFIDRAEILLKMTLNTISLILLLFYQQGGSWISTGDEASRFARYAFRRHFIQHAGFRLARSVETVELPARLIDSQVFVLGIGVQGKSLHYFIQAIEKFIS